MSNQPLKATLVYSMFGEDEGKIRKDELLERAVRDWYGDHHEGKPDQVWAIVPREHAAFVQAIIRMPDSKGNTLWLWRCESEEHAVGLCRTLWTLLPGQIRCAVIGERTSS